MLSIDIIVPTYNRTEDIKKFVEEIQKQKYPNYTVYIIDDCGDGDLSWLKSYNDQIHYTRLEKNQGQASARNIAIKQGKGDVVVSLDDDAWFYEDDNALNKLVTYFEQQDNTGCLMFNILEPGKKWISESRNLKEGDIIGSHITCGCAYRREALEKIGGFNEFFHSGAEETDISLKLIYFGYQLIFSENIRVFHNYNGGERTRKWYNKVRFNTTRNDLLIVLMYFPFSVRLKYFIGKYLSHLKFSLTNKRTNRFDQFTAFLYTFTTIFIVPFYSGRILKNRKIIPKEKFQKWLGNRW